MPSFCLFLIYNTLATVILRVHSIGVIFVYLHEHSQSQLAEFANKLYAQLLQVNDTISHIKDGI